MENAQTKSLPYNAINPLLRTRESYVDRILKSETPTDLPVQAPTKYQLVINSRTDKALRLTLPRTLLASTDEIIE